MIYLVKNGNEADSFNFVNDFNNSRITSENINFEHKKEKQKWNEPIGKKTYPRIIISFINLSEESLSEK